MESSTENAKNLGDMPFCVLLEIEKYLRTSEKWALHGTSRGLRKFIDPFLPSWDSMCISLGARGKSVRLRCQGYHDMVQISYEEVDSGKVRVSYDHKEGQLEDGGNAVELMIRDIRCVVENPKNRLQELEFGLSIEENSQYEQSFFQQLKPILESLENIQKVTISVRKIEYFHWILSKLKPGVLENISLENRQSFDLPSEIFELEQWKKAKRVSTSALTSIIPMDNVIHLEQFEADIDKLKPKEVLEIKNRLVSDTSGTLRELSYRSFQRVNYCTVDHLLGPFNSAFRDTRHRRHFRILQNF